MEFTGKYLAMIYVLLAMSLGDVDTLSEDPWQGYGEAQLENSNEIGNTEIEEKAYSELSHVFGKTNEETKAIVQELIQDTEKIHMLLSHVHLNDMQDVSPDAFKATLSGAGVDVSNFEEVMTKHEVDKDAYKYAALIEILGKPGEITKDIMEELVPDEEELVALMEAIESDVDSISGPEDIKNKMDLLGIDVQNFEDIIEKYNTLPEDDGEANHNGGGSHTGNVDKPNTSVKSAVAAFWLAIACLPCAFALGAN